MRATLPALLWLASCASSDQGIVSNLGDTLLDAVPEPPGDACPEGGTAIRMGTDRDRDGVLDDHEVTETTYVCAGYDRGALLSEATEVPPGDPCPNGGTRVDLGQDADGDGTLDPEEITDTLYVCDGADGVGVPLQVALSPNAGYGIRAGGELVSWGDGIVALPPPVGTFVDVDPVNDYEVCAVGSDGALTCWSNRNQDTFYVWDYVPPAGTFVAWSGHCGLRDDGTVGCLNGASLPGTYTALAASHCARVNVAAAQCDTYACGIDAAGALTCRGVDGGGGDLTPPPGTYVAVSVGWDGAASIPPVVITPPEVCGIRDDASLVCWGSPSFPGTPPSGTFQSVSVGLHHACAIRTDGTLACWGGQTPDQFFLDWAPTGTFSSVSAGVYETCAQRTTGEVACWGYCLDGECDPPPELYF
jgi:hypothetical protein